MRYLAYQQHCGNGRQDMDLGTVAFLPTWTRHVLQFELLKHCQTWGFSSIILSMKPACRKLAPGPSYGQGMKTPFCFQRTFKDSHLSKASHQIQGGDSSCMQKKKMSGGCQPCGTMRDRCPLFEMPSVALGTAALEDHVPLSEVPNATLLCSTAVP